MRAVLFALSALLTASPAVMAQGWANKLFKEQVSHDFGTVARGAQLYHRFPFTNIYAVPLEITNIRVSCGCLTATPNSKVIGPRESGYIDVLMDARRFSGEKTVTIHVTVGPTYISTAELKVKAVSRADIVYNPGQISFGSVTPGQPASQTIDIEYAGNLDWRITEVLSKDHPFEATLRELYRRPSQVGYQVKITLKPDVPAGALKRELHLRTNDPNTSLITVLVEADVQSALTLSPSVLRLGELKVGDSSVRKVVVRGQKPFLILGVDGQDDSVTLLSQPSATPLQQQLLTFKCEPKKSGEFRKQLSIRTDQQSARLTLTIEATVGEN